jgi:signal recognition particle receptor subunit beta
VRDVDGVIFVADSRWSRAEANVESLHNLQENVARHGNELARVPQVMLWNKRDLVDAMPEDYLEWALNNRLRPANSWGSIATTGENLLPALNTLAMLMLRRFDPAEATRGARMGLREEPLR